MIKQESTSQNCKLSFFKDIYKQLPITDRLFGMLFIFLQLIFLFSPAFIFELLKNTKPYC